MTTKTRVLSGITPSGSLTLGNHLGALRRFAAAQEGQEGYFFVADLHAMTMPHEPARLRRLTLETAALFFGAGLDPERSTVFLQSQVPAHVELSYLLESTAYVGELSRMIQFKEKGGRPRTRASLFTYPCLMAADILLYDTETVPVGGDQDQHVELARDLALRFNREYGDTFVVPEVARAALAARVVDLADPTAKMSKSAPDDAAGVIRMLDEPRLVHRKINRAVTDSDGEMRYDPDRKPGVSNLLDILAAAAGSRPVELADRFTSYGELKKHTAEAVIAMLEPIQRRTRDLLSDEAELVRLLRHGAKKAAAQAGPVLARARSATGLL
ncbi:MAG: tryptophan--tRNA ligase [Nocardioidaceae bacterium]